MSKKKVAIDSFDSTSIGNEAEYLNILIASNDFMVFLKTGCPFTFKLKQLLDSFNVKYTDLYLNNHINGPRLQGKLNEWTNQESPYVYVKKVFIGGFKETAELLTSGILKDVIAGVDLSKFEYDLVVIGGGIAGITAALEASKYGKKVALCDSPIPTAHGTTWGIGGSPAGSGSVSKVLFHRAATIQHDFKDGKYFGWEIENLPSHDWSSMAKNLSEQLNSRSFEYQKNLRDSGIEYIQGWARLKNNHEITVTNAEGENFEKSSKTFIIATGSRHQYLEIQGEQENTLAVEDILSLPTFEGKRILIVGSGKDALEVAGFLGGLGIDTTVIVRRKILPRVDQEIVELLKKSIECCGVKFVSGVTVVRFSKVGNSIRVEGKRTRSESRRSSKILDFSQRKLSELGSKKSPPPTPLPELADEVAKDAGDKSTIAVPSANKVENSAPDDKEQTIEVSKNDSNKEASGVGSTGGGTGDVDKEKSTAEDKKPTGAKSEEDVSEEYFEEFDLVVVAAGRRPNVADLGIQNLNLKLCRNTCKIEVNDLDQTSVENIFAIGKVTTALNADTQGVARKAAQLLVRRMFNLSQVKMNYNKTPQMILTPIEYAALGDTEENAVAVHGPKIEVYRGEYTMVTSAVSNRFDSRSFVKAICAPTVPGVGRQVVGVHVIAPRAGEVVQGLVPAFLAGTLTKERLDEMAELQPSRAALLSDLDSIKSVTIPAGSSTIR
ncbi:Hypothetical protein NTJ_06143 [Nesidiocoris tenuis]|uniref:FAD/NAD(P)-binding domain-containing protein n=1 Tax=Nesidiocoris tenuis TaxID=355587 RepID=A0ABN7API0_9HEMI|nr:Hypothetical protein NTJ_06143 [Nesidiocoris tenuis]